MSYNNSSVPQLPSLSAILDEEERKYGAPALITVQDTRLPDLDAPLNGAELAVHDAWYNDFYQVPKAAPSSTPGAGPQLFRERPRKRRLAPAPTLAPTSAPTPAPTVQESRPGEPVRKARKEKKVSRRAIGKRVDQACQRCRINRQKCDGEKPKCKRCSSRNSQCTYVQTERQIEVARKKAAETANAVPDFNLVEPPRPVETAPAESHELTHHWQPLFPLPEASFGGLTATPRELNMGFEGFPARPNMYSEYDDYSDWNFGGFATGPNEDQYGGMPGTAFRGLGTIPNGFSQNAQEPEWTLNPSLTSYGPAFIPNLYEPGLGFEFTNFPQIRPDHGHDQIEQSPSDDNQAALAHFAELDSMNAPGYGRR